MIMMMMTKMIVVLVIRYHPKVGRICVLGAFACWQEHYLAQEKQFWYGL